VYVYVCVCRVCVWWCACVGVRVYMFVCVCVCCVCGMCVRVCVRERERLSYLIKIHTAIDGILQLIHLWICWAMHVHKRYCRQQCLSSLLWYRRLRLAHTSPLSQTLYVWFDYIWSDKILFQPEPHRTAAATLLWQAAHRATVKYAPLNLNTAFLCYIFFLSCYNVLVETSIAISIPWLLFTMTTLRHYITMLLADCITWPFCLQFLWWKMLWNLSILVSVCYTTR